MAEARSVRWLICVIRLTPPPQMVCTDGLSEPFSLKPPTGMWRNMAGEE